VRRSAVRRSVARRSVARRSAVRRSAVRRTGLRAPVQTAARLPEVQAAAQALQELPFAQIALPQGNSLVLARSAAAAASARLSVRLWSLLGGPQRLSRRAPEGRLALPARRREFVESRRAGSRSFDLPLPGPRRAAERGPRSPAGRRWAGPRAAGVHPRG